MVSCFSPLLLLPAAMWSLLVCKGSQAALALRQAEPAVIAAMVRTSSY